MLIESLILQTKLFLQEDMGLSIKDVQTKQLQEDTLTLKEYTSMIGVGGTINVMVVISYDKEMLQKLVDLFMDGESIDPQEEAEIKDSVAGEVINTIMGLALPTFPNRGKGVTITPPIAIKNSTNLVKQKSSKVLSVEIQTDYGTLSINAIGTEDIIK